MSLTLSNFYLFCFAFGFLFSVIAVLSGHLHVDTEAPGLGGDDVGASTDGGSDHVSPWNLATGAAFLAWFGGTGYLATRFYGLLFAATLAMSVAAGIAGAAIVYLFLTKVLMRSREELDPADYDMIGVLGQVSGTIRAGGGVGEILYSRDGARRCAPARSDDEGLAIAQGEEVVVTRYENGIAYVRRWSDLTGQ